MSQKQEYNISEKNIDEAISQEIYLQVGFKTAICILVVNTGFEAVGHYSPIEVDAFEISEGKAKSREAAVLEVRKHLESISLWKKAVHEAKEEAKRIEEEQAKFNKPNEPKKT